MIIFISSDGILLITGTVILECICMLSAFGCFATVQYEGKKLVIMYILQGRAFTVLELFTFAAFKNRSNPFLRCAVKCKTGSCRDGEAGF